MKLYENVVIGNFLYALGYNVRAHWGANTLPSIVSLLQQTPTDSQLADVLIEQPGVMFLLEFKQSNNRSGKEKAKRLLLQRAVSKEAKWVGELSRDVHFHVETSAASGRLDSKVLPYLDAELSYGGDSLEVFVQKVTRSMPAVPGKWSEDRLRFYLSKVADCALEDVSGGGGLLCKVDATGCLTFAELIDLRQLRLQHSQYIQQWRDQAALSRRLQRQAAQVLRRMNRSNEADLEISR